MLRTSALRVVSVAVLLGAVPLPAVAFTTPFTFHCRGNACNAVRFLDEGVGCVVVTNHSRFPVHITMGTNQLTKDLQPGETFAPLINTQCYGYYNGGETATFIRGPVPTEF